MDWFSFGAGIAVGIILLCLAVVIMTWLSLYWSADHVRQWSPSEYSTEDDAGNLIVVGDDPWSK
jgi:hypothetical protein